MRRRSWVLVWRSVQICERRGRTGVASRAAEAEGTVLKGLKSVGLLLKLVLGRWVFDRGDDYKRGNAGTTPRGGRRDKGLGCSEREEWVAGKDRGGPIRDDDRNRKERHGR